MLPPQTIENAGDAAAAVEAEVARRQLSAAEARTTVRLVREIPGSCERCALRFLGVQRHAVYALPAGVIASALDSLGAGPAAAEGAGPAAAPRRDGDAGGGLTCPLCLGVLQHGDSPFYVDPVVEALRREDYDAPGFDLRLTVPSSILVRTQSVLVYLRKRSRDLGLPLRAAPQATADLKETLRHLLGCRAAAALGKRLDPAPSPLTVTAVYENPDTARDHVFLTQVASLNFTLATKLCKGKTIVTGDSRPNIAAALGAISDKDFLALGACPPAAVAGGGSLAEVVFSRSPVFVGGRYLKLSRDVSQTPFVINGQRKGETSVAEIIGDVVAKAFRADSYNLVSSGREDVDVRMLNEGRPFYLEITNPRTACLSADDVRRLQLAVNAQSEKVRVRYLGLVSEEATGVIKEGEESKSKTYRSLVWVASPITPDLLGM
ncbi:MAG: hypothetical protein BJ554DRAFT_1695, partial [Olpidium bornovanus]